MDSPPSKPDIWSEDKHLEKIEGPTDYLYFVIKTAVGVGAKGRNNIKRIHVRFRLISMNECLHEPEVVSIYPHQISQTVGRITGSEKFEKELGVEGSANPVPANFNTISKLRGMFRFNKLYNKKMDYELPYQVLIANASGVGDHAMWEFYQVEGRAAIGQFDLKVHFRIPERDISPWPDDGIIRSSYCIDWNVEVNGKRLVDHTIDTLEGNWNMTVNRRRLRAYESDDKLRDRWTFRFDDIPSEEKTKLKDEIYNAMIYEAPEVDSRRLLRPLHLVCVPKKAKT